MEAPMFLDDDRVTIDLSHEEALQILMLSAARALRRQRAGVQPNLPGECPLCLAPVAVVLTRECGSGTSADDWEEVYCFQCKRCGSIGNSTVGWPKNRGLSLTDYLWGPHADLDEEYRGNWDAQRRARENEPLLGHNAWDEIYELALEHHLDVGSILAGARLVGLFEDSGHMTVPEFEALENAFAILDGECGLDEEGDAS